MERVVAALCVLVGGFWAFKGFVTYGFWVDKGPGGGFLPIVIGLLTVILSLVLLKRSFTKKAENKTPVNLKIFIPIFSVLAAVFLTKILGLVLTMVIMVFIWLKFLEKYTYLHASISAMLVGIFVYGIFRLWLQVLLPTGLIGI